MSLRIRLLGLALALSALTTVLSGQNQPPVSFQLKTSPDDLVLDTAYAPDQTPVTHVRLRGAVELEQPGLPRLPYYSRLLALPAGAKVTRISVKGGQTTTRQGVPLLAWGQPRRPGREPAPPSFPVDNQKQVVYHAGQATVPLAKEVSQLTAWPPQTGVVVDTYEQAGMQIVQVALFPVVWNPAAGTLRHDALLDVTVEHLGGQMGLIGKDYATVLELQELRDLVVNPDIVPRRDFPAFPQSLDAWHLIITDNFAWDAATIRQGARLSGDMVAEFERLAQWKTEKGVQSAVVTVTDIVGGRYGNFKNGARDLQEVLRNFLKHARRSFNTSWVVLGGDASVIPAREVLGNVWGGAHHYHWDAAKPRPDKGGCYWDAATSTMRVHDNGKVEATLRYFAQRTGRPFARVAAPSLATPGWAYTTDDSYATVSLARTEFVIIRGPAAELENNNVYLNHYENRIPTDLYYASVDSPLYDRPGLHDWDANDNGFYGQADWRTQLDGVDFSPDLRVGRAPVETGDEARAFVDKVIAYERYDGFPDSFGRKLLLGADNWYGGPGVREDDVNPPAEERYYHAPGSTLAKLHFKGPPSSDVSWKLVAYNGPGDWRVVPYNREASVSSPGWSYATDATYTTVSHLYINFFFTEIDVPIPTGHVRVVGPSSDLSPVMYFFDDERPESAVVEKEEIRALLGSSAPGLNVRSRLYTDYVDTPDYPAADLFELSAERMQAELNTGYNYVSLSGHGWWGGCCGVDFRYVQDLVNGKQGGLVYADSCLTGEFNVHPNDAFDATAEYFVKGALGGSAAYIGSTRFSWIGLGHVLEKEFASRISSLRSVGSLHNTKRLYAGDWTEQWANFSVTLFGDPEMPLWVGTPKRLRVTHPASVVVGNSFTVVVRDPSSAPVILARTCVTGEGDSFEVRYTNAFGEATFSSAEAAIGEALVVTVTHRDHVPYQGAVRVDGPIAEYFVRGDVNLDSKIDLSDSLRLLGFLFLGQGKIACMDAADANDDGRVELSDAIKILNVLFLGDLFPKGTTFGKPQKDETPDNLGC